MPAGSVWRNRDAAFTAEWWFWAASIATWRPLLNTTTPEGNYYRTGVAETGDECVVIVV